MDWKRFRDLRVPENHPCCAYMDSELVSLLLTRTNMTWMLIPVDGFQGVVQSFQICCTGSCSGDFVTRSLSNPKALTGLYIAFKSKA